MTGQLPKDPISRMMKKGETGVAAMQPSPEQAFDAPWHAEVFALAVHLNEGGHLIGRNGQAGLVKIWRRQKWSRLAWVRGLMAVMIIIKSGSKP